MNQNSLLKYINSAPSHITNVFAENKPSPIHSLPPEIVGNIFSFLPQKSLVALSVVSKNWNNTIVIYCTNKICAPINNLIDKIIENKAFSCCPKLKVDLVMIRDITPVSLPKIALVTLQKFERTSLTLASLEHSNFEALQKEFLNDDDAVVKKVFFKASIAKKTVVIREFSNASDRDMSYWELVLQRGWSKDDLEERVLLAKQIIGDYAQSEALGDVIRESFSKDNIDLCLHYAQQIVEPLKRDSVLSSISHQYLYFGEFEKAREIVPMLHYPFSRNLLDAILEGSKKRGTLFVSNGMRVEEIEIPKNN